MLRNHNRSAWVWVTIAAIALVSVGRADVGRHGARAGMRAALSLLNRSQSLTLSAKPGMAQFVPRAAGRRVAALLRGSGIGAWVGILSILFVGMVVSPIAVRCAASLPRSGRTPVAPLLPSAFQRPPPRLA
ncbi:MAG TPA: hypothetical protein VLZ50_16060 [Terracidiphilus sp.]|nr:hypothetical protein [Terracidiphilus sp.]